MTIDLTDLVDNPRETLNIELKSWLDLSEGVNKANIARHIAALCNNGGGYLVFGFQDDFSVASDRPASLDAYKLEAQVPRACDTRSLKPASMPQKL